MTTKRPAMAGSHRKTVRWGPVDLKTVLKRLPGRPGKALDRSRSDSTEGQATLIRPKTSQELSRAVLKGLAFPDICEAAGLPRPVCEHRFHAKRMWRFDYAWPASRVAVEVEGGLFSKGRAKAAHAMPLGILRDMEKSNAAQLEQWTVLRYPPNKLLGALEEIRRALA